MKICPGCMGRGEYQLLGPPKKCEQCKGTGQVVEVAPLPPDNPASGAILSEPQQDDTAMGASRQGDPYTSLRAFMELPFNSPEMTTLRAKKPDLDYKIIGSLLDPKYESSIRNVLFPKGGVYVPSEHWHPRKGLASCIRKDVLNPVIKARVQWGANDVSVVLDSGFRFKPTRPPQVEHIGVAMFEFVPNGRGQSLYAYLAQRMMIDASSPITISWPNNVFYTTS